MEWLQITVTTTTEFSDIVAMCINDLGSDGVSIKDINDIKDVLDNHNWDYCDDSLLNLQDSRVFVSGFFAMDFCLNDLIESLDFYKSNSEVCTGSLEVSSTVIKSQDYENEWRKYYSPIEIGKIVIVPQWVDYPQNDFTQVKLDPGMAFGTGSHETTALCVKLMQDFDLKNKTIADVGCGSGILGIAALKLGAEKCFFVDIDDQAIKATHSNCRLNNVTDKAQIYQGNLLDTIDCKLDFCVANITANVLLILLPDIVKSLKVGAGIVISGIINKFASEVYSAYCAVLKPLSRENNGEWNAMSFVKE